MALIKSKQIESLHADKIIESSSKMFVTEEQIKIWSTGTGSSGKNIELIKSDTHILWRMEGEEDWKELISLSDITGSAGAVGANGKDGKNIELTKTSTHIMWRYAGQNEGIGWIPLIEISEITGPAGSDTDTSNLATKSELSEAKNLAFHTNRSVLDNLSDNEGQLYYKGDAISAIVDTSNLATKDELKAINEKIGGIATDEEINNMIGGILNVFN